MTNVIGVENPYGLVQQAGSRRKSYRRRTSKSRCGKIGYTHCNRKLGCKRTKTGKTKSHCRSYRRR
jgi:hypothetical protein